MSIENENEFEDLTLEAPNGDEPSSKDKKVIPDKKKHTFEFDLEKNDIVKDFGPGDEEEMLAFSEIEGLDPDNFEYDFDENGELVEIQKKKEPINEDPPKESPKLKASVPPTPDTSKDKKPEKSRAQERIRELANAKKDLEAKLAEKERVLDETNKVYAELEVKRLDMDLENLKSQLERAYSDGDAKKAAELSVEITKKVDLRNRTASYVDQASKQSTQQPDKSSDNPVGDEWKHGKEFLIETSIYSKLPVDKRKKLVNIRKDLIEIAESLVYKERYDASEQEFYDELDLRLSLKYPLYKNILEYGSDALDIDEDDNNEGDEGGMNKNTPHGDAKKPHNNANNRNNSSGNGVSPSSNNNQQRTKIPVNGTSSPGVPINKPKKDLGFKITEEDKRYYQNHLKDVMSFEDYVREMAKTVKELRARKQL